MRRCRWPEGISESKRRRLQRRRRAARIGRKDPADAMRQMEMAGAFRVVPGQFALAGGDGDAG